jgi:S-DNA-T family DNA segregation ATPase FtsK/SpoIIIE
MMGIGYPKAARIINELEAMGIIGPQNGSKPREVYDFLDKDN